MLIVLLALTSFGSGCATLTLATLGTALGVAGSAAATGGSVYSQGKLDSAEMVTVEVWAAAVRSAGEELHLKVCQEPILNANDPRRFTLTDDRGTRIGVRIDRRTETMLYSRVDVGLFGSEPAARLVLSRIRHHAGVPVEGEVTKSE